MHSISEANAECAFRGGITEFVAPCVAGLLREKRGNTQQAVVSEFPECCQMLAGDWVGHLAAFTRSLRDGRFVW